MEKSKKILLISKDEKNSNLILNKLDESGHEIYPVQQDFSFCFSVLDDDFDAIISDYIPTVEETETIKKYVIEKKISGSFIMINPVICDNLSDNSHLKKVKELCLFADIITPTYEEALKLSNLSYKEECEEKDIEVLVFKLNSFGMAHKIVIPAIKIKGRGICTVVSEFGEFELVDNNDKDAFALEFHKKYIALMLNELLSGKNIVDAVNNINVKN